MAQDVENCMICGKNFSQSFFGKNICRKWFVLFVFFKQKIFLSQFFLFHSNQITCRDCSNGLILGERVCNDCYDPESPTGEKKKTQKIKNLSLFFFCFVSVGINLTFFLFFFFFEFVRPMAG